MSRNLSALSYRKGLKQNLFEELSQAAQSTGTPAGEDLEKLAREFLIGTANTFGSATFYDFLKPDNKGKKVYVCNGSACLTAGTQPGLVRALEERIPAESIGHMCCLGRCHENGAFQFDGRNYSACSVADLDRIFIGRDDSAANEPVEAPGENNSDAIFSPVEKEKTIGVGHYAVGSLGTPILTAPFTDVKSWYALWEAMLDSGNAGTALAEVRSSGLRGRGGAGFPMHIKLETCRNTVARERFVVCNADEGDPGAYTDRYLMEQRPHAVLFGLMAAGWMAGAETGVMYIRGEYPESIKVIRQAVEELKTSGLIGQNVRGSGFSFQIAVIAAQGAYICGEETALLASIEGQRPEVRVRPPFPAQEGLFRLPTVVNNVETLAALHRILENGGDAYARTGRGRSTGTKLLSLDGHFRNPGVFEVEMGTPLKRVFDELGGGFRHPVKALHIGGPLGGLVPVSHIDRLLVDFESFAENGFLLGHASVLCIPESFPLIRYLEHLFQFTAHESCGKCFPCRIGSVRGQELMAKASAESGQPDGFRINRELLDDLLDTLEKGSLCALGGGLPLPVRNALQYFESELQLFFEAKNSGIKNESRSLTPLL